MGDPTLTYRHQPLSHQRVVAGLSLFYRYSNGFCSSELTSIILPLTVPARCTRGTSSSHLKTVVLHTSRTERYDRIFVLIAPASVQVPLQQTSLNITYQEQLQFSGI
nr:unnamed protein product [Callosobruchus chinensis]